MYGVRGLSVFQLLVHALEVILTVAIKELPRRFHKVNYLQEERALPQGEFSPPQMSLRVSYFPQKKNSPVEKELEIPSLR